MPGTRLSHDERRLAQWWREASEFPFPMLKSVGIVGIPGLRGIQHMNLSFPYPLGVICGQNGCGKTTILALAALGFHSPPGHIPLNARRKPKPGENFSYYTFQDFFFKGPGDPELEGLAIEWEYEGASPLTIIKQSKRWMRYYDDRPQRPVHYIGVSRCVPAIERNVLRSYFGGARRGSQVFSLNEEFRRRLSDIMMRTYDEAQIVINASHSLRRARSDSIYSSFNMGAGEDILIDLLYTLQECPVGTLLIIEEIELGLHPEALRRLAKHLQEIMLIKRLQIIVSTHSQHFIDSVPRVARILLQRASEGHHICVNSPTTRFALSHMSGIHHPELHVYCEDYFSSLLISHCLPSDLRRRIKVIPVGSSSELAKQGTFHIRAGLRHQVLLIWDGDVDRGEARGWLAREIAILPGYAEKTNCAFLPGMDKPETFVLANLDCQEGYELLAGELTTNGAQARGHINQMSALADHREIGTRLANSANIEEKQVLPILAKCLARIPTDPLRSIKQIVQQVLDGQHVDPECVLQTPMNTGGGVETVGGNRLSL